MVAVDGVSRVPADCITVTRHLELRTEREDRRVCCGGAACRYRLGAGQGACKPLAAIGPTNLCVGRVYDVLRDQDMRRVPP